MGVGMATAMVVDITAAHLSLPRRHDLTSAAGEAGTAAIVATTVVGAIVAAEAIMVEEAGFVVVAAVGASPAIH